MFVHLYVYRPKPNYWLYTLRNNGYILLPCLRIIQYFNYYSQNVDDSLIINKFNQLTLVSLNYLFYLFITNKQKDQTATNTVLKYRIKSKCTSTVS